MAINDRTRELRNTVAEKYKDVPESKRRRVDGGTGRGVDTSGNPQLAEGHDALNKQYISEAYVVLNHITTLTRMLANVRKAYLNMDTRNMPFARQASARNLDFSAGGTGWTGIRHLTNEERDQIDFQARDILKRCADRVKDMEALEKRRVETIASKASALSRFLPSRLRQEDASSISSDFYAAHHASITWYLNRRLAEVSQSQKEMQEERVKRQLERTRSLGSSATWEAANFMTKKAESTPEEPPPSAGGGGSWLGEASSNFIAATIGAPSPRSPHPQSAPPNIATDIPPSDSEDDDLELSASQILQFEEENAHILASAQETLQSVQQAESRLMDISALQMELVSHLTQQTELTDQLYEDVIATASTVDKGNVQLREAQRRAKDSRLFILLFFIGASLSLLFLHYY